MGVVDALSVGFDASDASDVLDASVVPGAEPHSLELRDLEGEGERFQLSSLPSPFILHGLSILVLCIVSP